MIRARQKPEVVKQGNSWRSLALAGAVLAASLSVDAAHAGDTPDHAIVIYPERPATVPLSNRDINRVHCPAGAIEDVKYSTEKGILVEGKGSDAYVKFQILEVGETRKFVTARAEFYIVCAGATYTLFGAPADMPAQTIFLGGPEQDAKTNAAVFNPLSDEERAIQITHAVLKENTPSSFARRMIDAPFEPGLIPGADVRERARVSVEGSGMTAAEFLVRASRAMRLEETMFLRRAFGASLYAVTIDEPELKAGGIARVVIVYRGSGR